MAPLDLIADLKAYEPELIAIRQDIHRHTEVGFEETRTAALVAERLRAWGLDVTEGLAKTPEAFIGMLAGRNMGKQLIHVASPSSR